MIVREHRGAWVDLVLIAGMVSAGLAILISWPGVSEGAHGVLCARKSESCAKMMSLQLGRADQRLLSIWPLTLASLVLAGATTYHAASKSTLVSRVVMLSIAHAFVPLLLVHWGTCHVVNHGFRFFDLSRPELVVFHGLALLHLPLLLAGVWSAKGCRMVPVFWGVTAGTVSFCVWWAAENPIIMDWF